MSANQIVRDHLFRLAGPILAVIGIIVIFSVNMSVGIDNVTLTLATLLCAVFAFLPLAAGSQKVATWYAAAMVLLFFATLAYPGLTLLGIHDAGSYLICLVPMFGGFFVGRKMAASALALVFAYAAALAWKHGVQPDPVTEALTLAATYVQIGLFCTASIGAYLITVIFDAKSDSQLAKLNAANTDLEAARLKAHAADKAKSEFLANMSHEIRTPMNGVIGMAELLATTELTSKQKLFTDTIIKSGSGLLTIINDILDFSKIEAGQLTLDAVPFNLPEAIEDVAAIIAPRIGKKNIELIVRVAPNVPQFVCGDSGRVRQILINLVGNAVKFTDEGQVFVEVTCAARKPAPGQFADIAIQIKDTGIGMKPDECETVFKKFSQADSSSTRKHEGTGLGLSIAASLAAMMGGSISLTSEYGKGSTFTVALKLQMTEYKETKQMTQMPAAGKRVLVIDDNPVNRAILLEQLRSWGLDCAAANSGAEGLAFMESAAAMAIRVDLVILDYQMPGMDGKAVLTTMRADPRFRTLPVLLLTSVDSAANDREMEAMGLEATLIKPARSSALQQTVANILGRNPDKIAPLAALSPAAETGPRKNVGKAGGEPEARTSGLTEAGPYDLLVAEDNDINQMVISQFLDTLDISYMIVENGRKAVHAFRKHKPKLILMDISMPEMNGKEATGAIRAVETVEGGHVPIVALTAHALKGDMEDCLNAGMDYYVSKPVNFPQLKSIMEKHLGALPGRVRSAA